MPIELVSHIGHMLYFGGNRKSHGRETAHFSQQSNEAISVLALDICTNLFENHAMPIELVSHIGHVLYFSGNGESHGRETAHFSQQSHKAVAVVKLK